MSKTHWKQLVNMDYLGAYALPDGKDLTLTIDKVVKEVVTGNSGRKEQCMVMYFKEPNYKPMILNRTNAKSIAALCQSQYVEDWCGHKVTLYGTTTRFGGDVVECLRIRPTVMEQAKTFTCENCGAEFQNEELAKRTKTKFGRVLCMTCGLAEAEKGKNETVPAE